MNPGLIVLLTEMMLRYLGWVEAADMIISAMEKTIQDKIVTYDLARLIVGAKKVKYSVFGQALIDHMDERYVESLSLWFLQSS